MGFRNPLTSLSVSQLLPGSINGLWTLGNVAGVHAEIGTNAGGQSGIRLYAPDGVTVLINLDALTGDGTFTGEVASSAAGQRVVLNAADDQLEFYDSAGVLVGVVRADPSGALIVSYPPGAASIQLDGAGVHILGGLDGGNTTVATLTALANAIISGAVTAASLTTSGNATINGQLTAASAGFGAGGTAATVSAGGAIAGSTVASTTGDVTAQNTCTCLNPPTTTTAANVWMNTSTGRLNKVTSARRFKTRIRRLRGGARVLALRPVSFQDKAQAKADPDAPRLWGFIADEVAQVAPELVSYDDRGRPEGVMYDRVVVGLLDVVRDLEHRCAAAGV